MAWAGRRSAARHFRSEAATMSQPNKPNNLKTALILAGVALFFFIAVFIKRS